MDTMANWLWQGGVVAIACVVMLRALARARANVRYLVCWAAAALVVALPGLSRLSAAAMATVAPVAERSAIVSLPDAWWTSSLILFAAWTAWVALRGVRFVSAIAAIRRARAGSRAFPADVEAALTHWGRLRTHGRCATLVVSDAVSTAAVLGWGRPVIAVAPSMVTLLDAEELDRVLIHEWAHVQRRDDLVKIVQIAVGMIAGWHPAIWWLDRRLHVEREIACDEVSVATAGSPKTYAECLIKLAGLGATPGLVHAAPAALTSSCLRARIITIVSARQSIAPVWSRSMAAAIVIALAVMSAGVGGLQLVDAAAFAQSVVSTRTMSAAPDPAPLAAAAPSSSTHAVSRRARRSMSPAESVQRDAPESSSPAPAPAGEPGPRVTPDPAIVVDTLPRADADASALVAVLPSAPPPAASPAGTAAEQVLPPWRAVATGGATVGRKSKDAGVATAGFFTRFAKRVAGSF